MGNTIKTYCELDYLIYLDKEKNVLGFEITPDDLQALALRYNSDDEKVVTMFPQGTEFLLEVFAINSMVLWTMSEDPKGGKPKGSLFYYKPGYRELSQEIVREIEHAYPVEEDKAPPDLTLKSPSSIELFLASKLALVPYTGWREDFFGTKYWMEIWRTKPYLQEGMLEFVKIKDLAKMKKKELMDKAKLAEVKGEH